MSKAMVSDGLPSDHANRRNDRFIVEADGERQVSQDGVLGDPVNAIKDPWFVVHHQHVDRKVQAALVQTLDLIPR